MSLLTKASPILNNKPPAKHIMTFKIPASSGVIIGIIINKSIPPPKTQMIDSHNLVFATHANVKAIEIKISKINIFEIKQQMIVPTLNPSILNGSPAIAPPIIPPIKNKNSMTILAIKQVMVFDITYSILFALIVNKFFTYPLLKSSLTKIQTKMATMK